MSTWQDHLKILTDKGHIDKAAITSLAGDSIWAADTDFKIQLDEMRNISGIFTGGEPAQLAAFKDGIYIAKERYIVVSVDEQSIYARGVKKDNELKNEQTGIYFNKTGQAIVLGHHTSEHTRSEATADVESLANFLIGMQY